MARPNGGRRRTGWVVAAVALAAVGTPLSVIALTRDDEGAPQGVPAASDPGPVHVHGMGINPRDDALFIATHTGLWRVPPNADRAERVTDRAQDTMGFTVVGPDRFLGSGHPDLREELPPHLGLIESSDAGRSWRPVSLLGEADFHVLRSDGNRVYGFDAANGRLMLSEDRGRSWTEREPPGALLDLAVDPATKTHLVATGERGLVESSDDGRTWRRLGDRVGFLAWPVTNRLYLVDLAGDVLTSSNSGKAWARVGSVGGEPAALTADGASTVYVALHEGTIMRSSDGGRSWTVRAAA